MKRTIAEANGVDVLVGVQDACDKAAVFLRVMDGVFVSARIAG